MIRLQEDDEDTLPPVTVSKPKKKKAFKAKSGGGVEAQVESVATIEEQQDTIFRSRETGQRITEEEWYKQQRKNQKKDSKKPRLTESQLSHGGGIIQRQLIEAEERHAQEILEAGFHRSEIQISLDKELKNQQRSEDPMKQFLTNTEELSERQMIHKSQERFVAPPNRFGIKAGSKWDGRVRGTGFEEKYLEVLRNLDREQTLIDEE